MNTIHIMMSWLNEFDKSHLSRSSKAIIQTLKTRKLSTKERNKVIKGLANSGKFNQDPLELPEILLNCAQIHAKHAEYKEAADYALLSRSKYGDDFHRNAISRWIRGIILWKANEPSKAYKEWFNSREIFKEAVSSYQKAKISERTAWYQEKVLEMEIDLCCTPEEVFTWLDALSNKDMVMFKKEAAPNQSTNYSPGTEYQTGYLKPAAKTIHKNIENQLKKRDFAAVYELIKKIEYLAKNSDNNRESGVILVISSLALYKMGNIPEAVIKTRLAIDTKPPEQHLQAVSRWLLGIYQWELPTEQMRATTNWQLALKLFHELAGQADSKNYQERRKWYQEKLIIMENAFERVTNTKLR